MAKKARLNMVTKYKLWCVQTCTGKSRQGNVQCDFKEVSSGRIDPQLQVTNAHVHGTAVLKRQVYSTLCHTVVTRLAA